MAHRSSGRGIWRRRVGVGWVFAGRCGERPTAAGAAIGSRLVNGEAARGALHISISLKMRRIAVQHARPVYRMHRSVTSPSPRTMQRFAQSSHPAARTGRRLPTAHLVQAAQNAPPHARNPHCGRHNARPSCDWPASVRGKRMRTYRDRSRVGTRHASRRLHANLRAAPT